MRQQQSLFPAPGFGLAGAGIWLIALATAAPAQTATNPPIGWGDRSLDSLSSTNAPEVPEHIRANPSLRALSLLRDAKPDLAPEASFTRGRRTNDIGDLVTRYDFEGDQLDAQQELIKARDLVLEANQLHRGGDTPAALRVVREGLDSMTKDEARYQLVNYLGSLYFNLQEYAQAAQFLGEAAEIRPHEPNLVCNLAAAQMSIGQTEEALKSLESIQVSLVQSRPLLFSIFFNLACVHSLLEHEEPALQNLLLSSRVDPGSTLASLGDTQLDNIRSAQIFKDFQKALEEHLGVTPKAE